MMNPEGMLVVTPMVVAVGEQIQIKVKLLGPVREISPRGDYNTKKPRLHGPFNYNCSRQILYRDNALPEWTGCLAVSGGPDLDGPGEILFDGCNQGVFPGDKRPIGVFGGWHWTKPGFHWIRLTDSLSGITGLSNPVYVVEGKPQRRIFWGDPHWQTFFTDGIRCPEELYAFAKDEAFLDFGAISDHAEGLTDHQWQYFTQVTNSCNQPGLFATLIGLEWTSMKFGHRNIYYRGNKGPILRSEDQDQNTLEKLWSLLEKETAIAIPHHSASAAMGVDWSNGWHPQLEPAVEIHSIWGSSECHADDGNSQSIQVMGGEKRGQHVIDALKLGYRFGFVGGGDIHDGRPGDELHTFQPIPDGVSPQGFTAVLTSRLTRSSIYDTIKSRATYATTRSRIYLDVRLDHVSMGEIYHLSALRGSMKKLKLKLTCAAADDIAEAHLMVNGQKEHTIIPDTHERYIQAVYPIDQPNPNDSIYVRLVTKSGQLAWSSPIWMQADE